jgi:Tfp pilus assembly protein PilZ
MIERGVRRVVPRLPVTLAVEQEGMARAFGVVANISEKGACLLTDGSFPVGTSLICALSFPREPQPFRASGRVVWAKPEPSRLVRCGVQFEPGPGLEPSRLSRLILGVSDF